MIQIRYTEPIDIESVLNDRSQLINDYTLIGVRMMLHLEAGKEDKKITIAVIQICNQEYTVMLNKYMIPAFLTNALCFYEEREQYEKCAECRDL